jgi:hypothetical protein
MNCLQSLRESVAGKLYLSMLHVVAEFITKEIDSYSGAEVDRIIPRQIVKTAEGKRMVIFFKINYRIIDILFQQRLQTDSEQNNG